MASRRYEDDEREDEAKEEASEESREESGDESQESEEGSGNGGQQGAGEPEEEMPPPGYDQWSKMFEYALKNHPMAYGMATRYEDSLGEPEGQMGGDQMPPEMAGEGMPEGMPADQGDQGGEDPVALLEELLQLKEAGQLPPEYEPVIEQLIAHIEALAGQEQAAGQEAGGQMEGQPGQVETPEESAVLDQVMSGGTDEMPPPQGDPAKDDASMVQAQNYGLLDGPSIGPKGAGRTAITALGGAALGGAAGALVGKPGMGAIAGLGAGTMADRFGGNPVSSQNNQVPVAYQAAFQMLERKMEQRLGALENRSKKKDAEIQKLQRVNAVRESELLVYQLQMEGVKAVADPSNAQALTEHLASLPPEHRQLKVDEIRSHWEKDASVAYAARGAPVGGYVHVDENGVSQRSNSFDESKLETALAYMRQTNKPWEECMQYAMTGGK